MKKKPTAKAATAKAARAKAFREVGTKSDKDGVFVTTHRARSKSYPSKEKIPTSVVKRIASTG